MHLAHSGISKPCLLLAVLMTACQNYSLQDEAAPSADGSTKICYRGAPVSATRIDGELVIEGDIIVMPDDIWCDDERSADSGLGVVREAVKRQGANYQWPNGIVPYAFDSTFSAAADQADAVAAMQDWEAAVPTLHFVPQTTEAAHIKFVKGSVCQAVVGHHSAGQKITLAPGCLGPGNFRVHHEIGHALGLYHQQTRKDRDLFVAINWGNIIGCPSTATQASHCGTTVCTPNPAACGCTAAEVSSGKCDDFTNFQNDNARSDLGAYDYDSVMHYEVNAFNKAGAGNTIQVLQNDASGNPFPIGQRSHLSEGDILAMRAMYPALATPSTIFSGKGSAKVCQLEGRTDDIAVTFDLSGSTSPITSQVVDRSQLLGDYTVRCSASSTFWADTYAYPNSIVAFNPGLSADTYAASARNMRVLSIGLVPALF